MASMSNAIAAMVPTASRNSKNMCVRPNPDVTIFFALFCILTLISDVLV